MHNLRFYSYLVIASMVCTCTLFLAEISNFILNPEELSPRNTGFKTLISSTNLNTTIMKNKQEVDWYLDQMIKFGTAISSLEENDLAPGPLANTLFSGLVSVVSEFPSSANITQKIMDNPTIQRLQPIVSEKCSMAEYLLEADFAQKIILKETKISDFLYHENYRVLVEFEVRSLEKYIYPRGIKDISSVVLIGSGPLPLTSIVLLDHLSQDARITNIDHSQEANLLGEGVVKSAVLQGLGVDYERISFVTCSALDLNGTSDLARADIVYLAALVGNNSTEKSEIISHLYKIMKPGSILLARSSKGLRKFIYHPVGKEEFQEFEQFQQFDPDNKVIINSIAVGKKLATN